MSTSTHGRLLRKNLESGSAKHYAVGVGGSLSEPDRMKEAAGARSLRRAAEILTLLERSGEPTSVGQIVRALALPRSTAYDILNVLLDTGLLEAASDDGKYVLGRRLFELGMQYREQNALLKESMRVLADLRDETGETVQLSVLDGNMMKIALKEEGRRAVRIISTVGTRVPVNWAAAGRLLVSDMNDDTLRGFLADSIQRSPTGRAPTDVTEIMRQVRVYRAQGYATEFNETNEHAGCVAAAVIDSTGRCVAAVSIAAPEARLRSEEFEILKLAVQRGAKRLSSLY